MGTRNGDGNWAEVRNRAEARHGSGLGARLKWDVYDYDADARGVGEEHEAKAGHGTWERHVTGSEAGHDT